MKARRISTLPKRLNSLFLKTMAGGRIIRVAMINRPAAIIRAGAVARRTNIALKDTVTTAAARTAAARAENRSLPVMILTPLSRSVPPPLSALYSPAFYPSLPAPLINFLVIS